MREYNVRTGRVTQPGRGRPSRPSQPVMEAIANYVRVRANAGMAVRPMELALLVKRSSGDNSLPSARALKNMKVYLKQSGICVRGAQVSKKAKAVGDVDRVRASFEAYERVYKETIASDPTLGPTRIFAMDETSCAMETANAGGGTPAVLVPTSYNGRVTLPGIEKGSLPSCTYASVVSLAGATIAHAFVFNRRQWSAKDFTRRFETNGDETWEHASVRMDDDDVLLIGNETGKFTMDDYHFFVEFSLKRARKLTAATTSNNMIWVHDNAPAHGDTPRLLRGFADQQCSAVTLAGGVTSLVQLHDVGLFGGFKVRMKRAMLNLRTVLCEPCFCLTNEYDLTVIDDEQSAQQKVWLAKPDDYEAELRTDMHRRLGGHDPAMSVREMVQMARTVWRVLLRERPTRVEEVAAFLGMYPLSHSKWMATLEHPKKPIHVLLREEKTALLAQRARTTDDGNGAGPAPETPPPSVTTRPCVVTFELRGVIGATPTSHESTLNRMLFNEAIHTLKKADNEFTVAQALSAASVMLRDGIQEGRFKTPFQQLALSPSGRTPSVGARHMQRIAEQVQSGGGRARGTRFEVRVLSFHEAAGLAVEVNAFRLGVSILRRKTPAFFLFLRGGKDWHCFLTSLTL